MLNICLPTKYVGVHSWVPSFRAPVAPGGDANLLETATIVPDQGAAGVSLK